MITKIVFIILALGFGLTFQLSFWSAFLSFCVGYFLADVYKFSYEKFKLDIDKWSEDDII